jgi:hypothetical protein
MGRILKRIPLNFAWLLGEIWEGYLNPHTQYRRECELCEGSGYGQEAKFLSDQWYGDVEFEPGMTGNKAITHKTQGVYELVSAKVKQAEEYYTGNGKLTFKVAVLFEIYRMLTIWNSQWHHHLDQDDVDALVEAGRLMDFTHVFVPGQGWQKRQDGYTPTAKEVNIWSLSGLGHDAINKSICVREKAKRLGYEIYCKACDGSGDQWRTEQDKKNSDNWETTEPPQGKGFQLWENTSEGSPQSPVFETLEQLCEWCEIGATTFGSSKTTKERWFEMLSDGFVYQKDGNMIFM